MFRNTLKSFGFIGLISSNASAASAEDYKRLEKEEDFVEAVVGKQLIYDDGAVVIFLEDRTLGGAFSGSRIWGEWVWRDDRVCHQVNVGEKRYKVDCREPQVDGEKIRFLREDGSFYGVAKIAGR